MAQIFKNNSSGTLSSALTNLATNIVLTSNQGNLFPTITGDDFFLVTLIGMNAQGAESAWEIVKCTAKVADTLTVVRGQEGTTAVAWPAGTKVELRLTAGTLDSFTDTAAAATAMSDHTSAADPHGQYLPKSGGTASGLTLNDGYTEEVFAVTGTTPALSPNNGSIQTWTLTGNSAPTLGAWASGQSMTLLIDDGTAYSINWASMGVVWKTNGGTAPVLLTTGYTALALVKVGGTVYGWKAGDA